MSNTSTKVYSTNESEYENSEYGKQLLSKSEKRSRFAMDNDVLLTMKDITAHSNLSDKHFYSLIKRGMFPRPLKIGRASRWRKSDYEAWLITCDTSCH